MNSILIVDDDPLMLRMYQKKFEVDGYDVQTASDGEEAFSKAALYGPDLILLDIMMPKLNGLDALKKLKEDESTKHIPVIMLTNVGSSEDDAEKGLSLGAVAYMVKANYLPKEIVQKVKEILTAYTKTGVPDVKIKLKKK